MFRFSFEHNKQDSIQYARVFYQTTLRKKYLLRLILGFVYTLACDFYFFYHFRRGVDFPLWLWLLVALMNGLALFRLFEPRVTGLRMEKNRVQRGQISWTFDDTGVSGVTNVSQSHYDYTAFQELFHSRQTYFLLLGKQQAVVIPERGLVEGDGAAFGAFLEEKTGLKIKEIK